MIIIISSAKTMVSRPSNNTTIPVLLDKTKQLFNVISNMKKQELSKVWDCEIDKVQQYFSLFSIKEKTKSIDAYNGIVFKQFQKNDLDYLNKHLRILSAYYGLLKPLDGIHPYRLEMASSLKINNENLYHFWNNNLYNQINDHVIINLASEEYSKCIRNYLTDQDVFIDIDFIELKNGKPTKNSTNLKKARGLFLNYLIQNKIEDINKLTSFNLDGYHFVAKGNNKLTFVKEISCQN